MINFVFPWGQRVHSSRRKGWMLARKAGLTLLALALITMFVIRMVGRLPETGYRIEPSAENSSSFIFRAVKVLNKSPETNNAPVGHAINNLADCQIFGHFDLPFRNIESPAGSRWENRFLVNLQTDIPNDNTVVKRGATKGFSVNEQLRMNVLDKSKAFSGVDDVESSAKAIRIIQINSNVTNDKPGSMGKPEIGIQGLGAELGRNGSLLHSGGSASRLYNGSTHVGGLALGNIVHLFNSSLQHERLYTEHYQLKDSDKDQNAIEPDRPSIGGRFLIALCLFIGGFLVSLRGWLDTHDNRGFISTACILCGLVLSCGGLILWELL